MNLGWGGEFRAVQVRKLALKERECWEHSCSSSSLHSAIAARQGILEPRSVPSLKDDAFWNPYGTGEAARTLPHVAGAQGREGCEDPRGPEQLKLQLLACVWRLRLRPAITRAARGGSGHERRARRRTRMSALGSRWLKPACWDWAGEERGIRDAASAPSGAGATRGAGLPNPLSPSGKKLPEVRLPSQGLARGSRAAPPPQRLYLGSSSCRRRRSPSSRPCSWPASPGSSSASPRGLQAARPGPAWRLPSLRPWAGEARGGPGSWQCCYGHRRSLRHRECCVLGSGRREGRGEPAPRGDLQPRRRDVSSEVNHSRASCQVRVRRIAAPAEESWGKGDEGEAGDTARAVSACPSACAAPSSPVQAYLGVSPTVPTVCTVWQPF